MKYLISPHDDDHALFTAFTCLREKPTVVVVLDSYVQPNRGETGCSAEERAEETRQSCEILGCPVIRLGLRDDNVTEEQIEGALKKLPDVDVIYAPALQGGNVHHDMVYRVATKLFKPIYYTTYTKTELHTVGDIEVKPTEEENALKIKSLECYQSQIRINKPHFDAVVYKSEWIGQPGIKIYLGAGSDRKPGFVHLDAYPFPGIDVVCDVSKGLPFPDNSADYIFSQDFLEHTDPMGKVALMNEIWRVLKPNGFMDHIVPLAGSTNDFGSPSHISHWHPQQFEHWDVDSYRYNKDRFYEGFKGGFRKISTDIAPNQQTFRVVYKAVK